MTYWASSEIEKPPSGEQDIDDIARQEHEAWVSTVVDWLREEACRDFPEPWPCDLTPQCLRYVADYLQARYLPSDMRTEP